MERNLTIILAAVLLNATAAPGDNLAEAPATNVLYVAVSGNDDTARKNRPDLPYATLSAVFAAVQSGETILISEGEYPVEPGFPSHRTGDSFAPMQLIGKENILVSGSGSNVVIYGEGRGDFLMIENCTNVCVQSLTFQGNRPDVVFEAVPLFGMIMLRGQNRHLVFQKCSFLDYGNHGITHLYDPKSSRHVTITQCCFARGGDFDLSGRGEDGAAVSGIGSHWMIASNIVDSCVRGFEVEGGGKTVATNITIQGNLLTNTMNLGIMVFVTSHVSGNFTDIRIHDNRLLNTRRHTNDYTYPILVTGGERISVVGNTVAQGDYVGIAMNASFSDLKDCSLVGNRVSDVQLRGIQIADFPPYVATNILIQGNVVERAGESGILAGGDNLTITDNECVDNGRIYVKAGIEIRPDSTGILIASNRIWSSAGRAWQDYGVWIQGESSLVSLEDNYIADTVIASVRDDALGTDYNMILHDPSFREDNRILLQGRGIPDVLHTFFTSTNLIHWQPLGTSGSDAYGNIEFSLDTASNTEAIFFRFAGSLP